MVKLGLSIQTAEIKIQGEIAKVVQSMRNDYQQALAQEQSRPARSSSRSATRSR